MSSHLVMWRLRQERPSSNDGSQNLVKSARARVGETAFYLEVSITNAPLGLNAQLVVEPSEAEPSLREVSKALHEVAEQILEGAPVGHTAISDCFVANWQFGGTLDDLDLTRGRPARPSKAESSPEPGNDVERDPRLADEFEEPEITQVSGFRIPAPQAMARASTKKNARPIYRYFPFKP